MRFCEKTIGNVPGCERKQIVQKKDAGGSAERKFMGQKLVLDWNRYSETAIASVVEGCVLLRNEGNVLPLKSDEKVAVFGRIQLDYYKSGTGSGGMVNVSHVVGITEALLESGKVEVNRELLKVYEDWCLEHPFDLGTGWGAEPWSQKEMELSNALCEKVAAESETALVVIGRTTVRKREPTF